MSTATTTVTLSGAEVAQLLAIMEGQDSNPQMVAMLREALIRQPEPHRTMELQVRGKRALEVFCAVIAASGDSTLATSV